MPNVEEIIRAMPSFISHIEAQCHAEESDETRIFSSPEMLAFHPRVFDVRVRELYRLHYHEKAFNCMRLRMGWHAKEDLK